MGHRKDPFADIQHDHQRRLQSAQRSYRSQQSTFGGAQGYKRQVKCAVIPLTSSVAAAFHAAQTGQLPTPGPERNFPRSKPTANGSRTKSPIEQVAASARALKPVRFFLRPPGEEGEEDESFPSFQSTDTSYDYQQEEAFVRAAQAAEKKSRRASDGRKRDEMPYRPGEDDWQSNSDESGGESEGIVRGGGLEGRAETRGTRKERGDGYLGNGLGIHRREDREQTPTNHQLSPNGRSPTPIQTLARAFSPHRSPTPQFARRKRHPSSARTVVTNLLHGIVLALRLFVELGLAALLTPFKSVGALVKLVSRRARTDWWKWLSALLALSLALRMLDMPWRGTYRAPNLPPESVGELVERLQHLEKAVALLSGSSKMLAEAERVGKEVDASLLHRVTELESAERHGDNSDVTNLRKSIATLKTEMSDITSRQSKPLDKLQTDLLALSSRVDTVERDVKSALDDGRFRAGLERILPQFMPVKRNGASLDIDPLFWTEMKRVLLGRTEVDEMIRNALGSDSVHSDKDLEQWGDKLIERKTADGTFVTRIEFVSMLESKISDLRHTVDTLPRKSPVFKSKGEDVTSLLQDLIDAALLKYSKDTLARPDFALFSAGGRVVPSITSDTLVMRQPSTLGRLVMGQKPIEGRSPATVLHPDTSVGSCWPFKGSQGQLGVLLNRRVVITDLTVEHAASDLALDTSTSPREIEVVSCPCWLC